MPVELIEKCLENGCEYLNLNDSHLINWKSNLINVPTEIKLKYLRVGGNYDEWGTEFDHEPDAVQVNLCQKVLCLHQLTYNMTTDCSLNYKFNT